jgi:hypothetical protein
MKRTNRLIAGVCALLLVHTGVVVWLNVGGESSEVFPIFQWDLFSSVPPADSRDFTIRLVEVDGAALDEPVFFSEARQYLSTTRNQDAPIVFNGLGKALEDDAILRQAAALELVNGRFLAELSSARYQVVRRHFNLLDRMECNCFSDVQVLGEFAKP